VLQRDVEQSLAMVTAHVPVIGYDRAAKIAKEAFTSGETVREVALVHKVLPSGEVSRSLGSVADDRAGNPGEGVTIEDGEMEECTFVLPLRPRSQYQRIHFLDGQSTICYRVKEFN
jgi:hypothetical protein